MACFGGVRIGNWNWNWPSFSILCLRTNYLTAANPNPAKPVDTCKTEISVGGVVDDLLPMLPTISKVAVIGAGSAGLAAARRLRDRGIETTIFECNSVAGGAWYVNEWLGGNYCVNHRLGYMTSKSRPGPLSRLLPRLIAVHAFLMAKHYPSLNITTMKPFG